MGKKTRFQWSRDEDNPEGVVHITERATWADQKKASKRVSALATALSKISHEKLDEFNLTPDVYAAVEESIRINNKGGVRGGKRRQILHLAAVIRRLEPTELETLFTQANERLNQRF